MPVALAEGTVFLPPDHLPFFEPFEKLNFWFPRDVAAFESVRAFAKKLDERKCSAVTRDVDNPSRKVSNYFLNRVHVPWIMNHVVLCIPVHVSLRWS